MLTVSPQISERPVDVSLGVVGGAATVPPPPPAKVFLDRAECLLEWALDAVREIHTKEVLFFAAIADCCLDRVAFLYSVTRTIFLRMV